MATINYPITKTVISAEGSAEVIAYGSNEYTDIWGDNLDTNWSLWDTFPTVVRVGNYVWCLWGNSSSHVYWRLIDVVTDPSGNFEFGNNVAYPEISNAQVESITNVQSAKLTDPVTQNTNITAGPYRPLAVTTVFASSSSSPRAGVWSDGNSYKEFIPIFSEGTIESFNIALKNTNVGSRPLVRGWGDYSTAKGTNGDTVYGRFPPFATQEQLETLYGKEHNWQSPYSNSYEWLFEAEAGSGSSVYNGELAYPFTVAAMVPNTLYRNVKGDTTGDGIDNTPSFEDALAGFAVASIIKCDGFPEDLIPGLDMDKINKKIDAAKAGIESAIDSAGLLDLEKNIEGLKAGIEDKFPKAVKVLNFVEAIADLDLNNLAKDAIEAAKDNLKEEWKDAIDEVDDFVDGIIDNIANFDICSLVGLKGKTGDDGKLAKKPESPSIPDKAIEDPKQSSYASTQSKGTAQTKAAASAGITPKDLENANNALEKNWQDLSEDDQFSWGRKIEVGPLQGPRRTIIRDDIEFEAVLDENGELVPKVRADGSRILSTDPDAFGSGAPAPYNDFSISDEANSISRVPLQQSEVKIHGAGIGTVYHRNKYKNLYADGNGGGPYTGIYKDPFSPSPENDLSIIDLIMPPDVPGITGPLTPPSVSGITDTDPERQKRIADYLNLEGGGSPEAANKLAAQAVSKTGPEWEKRLQEIKASKDYQTYVTAINNKVDPRDKYSLPGDSELGSRGGMSQESLDKLAADIQQVTIGLYIYREWKARFNYYKEKLKNSMLVDGKRGEYFPSTDYDITNKWKTYNEAYPGSLAAPGTSFGLNDVIPMGSDLLNTTMTKKAADTVAGMDDEFITAIDMYFFNEEGVRLQQEIMLGQDPPFDEIIQKKLLDALVPNDNEGDPVYDNVAPIKGYNPKDETNSSGRVINITDTSGAVRNGPIQPELMSILEKSAAEAKYTLKIFSGGQVPVAKGGKHKVNRWGNTKRHDDGYAVDIYTFNESGRQLRVQADENHKDNVALRDFIIILLKNGITSVGGDDDYMNGDLHLDIAIPSKATPIAHWGKGPAGLRHFYAPAWLTKIFRAREFGGDYNKQHQAMLIEKERKEKEKASKTNK